jgi:hypothetical protein
MTDPISFHHSFIVRCWRNANGLLRGWVVDALTQRSYPFSTRDEMVVLIESLAREAPKDQNLAADHRTDESLQKE